MKRATSMVRLIPLLLGAWLLLAAAAAPANADFGPSCGSKDHGQPPPRDGSIGSRGSRRARTAGGALVLIGGMASIWASTRRRGG
jgi:hypothetical protein